jgi:hypothetical protein
MGSKAMSVQDQVANWIPVPGAKDQHLAVSSAAVAFAALGETTKFCMINVQGGDVRMTLDGDDPVDGSVGGILKEGTYIYWARVAVEAMKFVRNGGTDAVVWMQEFTK